MRWFKQIIAGKPAISQVPQHGGTIDDALADYANGTGKGIPGITEFRMTSSGMDFQREKLVFTLQEFVRAAVVPNALHLSVYQETAIALLRLSAAQDEIEGIKLAIQARRTRFISNFYSMPTYPILQFVLAIFDQPFNPFKIESVRDITTGAVRGFIDGLYERAEFKLFVYDTSGEEFFFETLIAIRQEDRQQLTENVNRAAKAYLRIPDTKRDFKSAYQRFTDQYPIEAVKVALD